MEIVYIIGYYLACLAVGFNSLFLLPKYIVKRYKADNYRDAHHYEICILLNLVLSAIGIIAVIAADTLIKWPQ